MRIVVAVCVLVLALQSKPGRCEDIHSSAGDPCVTFPHENVPQASISNGQVHAILYLPDSKIGYYRSTRFDWSGVIPCLSYQGHTYFGLWKTPHDPLVHDSLSGPVEEFHPADGGLGYGEAKPGGLFVKPGVGVLRKLTDDPYKFSVFYPIVDPGKWTVHAKKSSVSFTHHLQSPIGYAYEYTKTVELAKGEPVLILHHHMKNTGTRTIDMDVYEHDFYMLDKTPTGPGMVVHFAFEPKATRQLTNGGILKGNDLTYRQELQDRQTVQSPLTGYSNSPADYKFSVVNEKTGAGVEQTADSSISDFNFWSVRTVIAPEAYVHIHIEPGATQDYTIRYRFFVEKPSMQPSMQSSIQ
jgi:hypothetical protein